jgi:hypothetical protein
VSTVSHVCAFEALSACELGVLGGMGLGFAQSMHAVNLRQVAHAMMEALQGFRLSG